MREQLLGFLLYIQYPREAFWVFRPDPFYIETPKVTKFSILFGKVISSSHGCNLNFSDIWYGFGRCLNMMKKYTRGSLEYIYSF